MERDPGASSRNGGNETRIGHAEFGSLVQEEVAGESGLLSHQLIGSFKAGDEIRGERTVEAGRSCRGPSGPIG